MASTKSKIIGMLRDIGQWETHTYKQIAYQKAVRTLELLDSKLFLQVRNFKSYQFIGNSINDKINEAITTGTMKKWELLARKVKDARLIKEKKTEIIERISILSAKAYIKILVPKLQRVKGVIGVTVCGSIRRQKQYIADADILCCVPDSQVADAVRKKFLTMGTVKVSGFKKTSIDLDGFQIDLNFCKPIEYGAALLHHTGSWKFNQMCRGIAKSKNMLLNQYGLWYRNESRINMKRVPHTKSEDQILTIILGKFVEPEKR